MQHMLLICDVAVIADAVDSDVFFECTFFQGWALHSFPFVTFHSFPFFKKNVTFFSVLFTMVISMEKYKECIYVYTMSLSLGTMGDLFFCFPPSPPYYLTLQNLRYFDLLFRYVLERVYSCSKNGVQIIEYSILLC